MTSSQPLSSFTNFRRSQAGRVVDVVQLTPVSRRVRVMGSMSAWTHALTERLNALTALQRGWDGYTALPVSFTCAQFAVQLIERLYDPDVPPPSLVPGADGTLQVEWHVNQYDIEIDVLGAFNIVAARYDCLEDRDEVLEIDTDITPLAGWIAALKVDRHALLDAGAA